MKPKYCKIFTLLLFSYLCFAGNAFCDRLPFGLTTIKEIRANPSHFDQKEIRIQGTVSDVKKISLPLLGDFQAYTVKDETGEIFVLTKNVLPEMGSKVIVKGVVSIPAILGNDSIGIHLKEVQRF